MPWPPPGDPVSGNMNLLKALATVSSMTLVSRVLGFVRDALIARVFGVGLATDAFFVAFKIPNAFVVGYGLDYQDLYRNLPYLAVLEPSEIEAEPV